MVLAKNNTLNHYKWLFMLENIQGMYAGICFVKCCILWYFVLFIYGKVWLQNLGERDIYIYIYIYIT